MVSRATARIDGDFVVFLIGMRVNKPWKVGKWLPVGLAMARTLKELEAAPPEVGFLGSMSPGLSTTLIQYWRSFDHLERYARATDKQHWPAWVEFNRRMKNARGDVGIWHETYLVRAGEYETVYSGMPLIGLAKERRTARACGSGTGRKNKRADSPPCGKPQGERGARAPSTGLRPVPLPRGAGEDRRGALPPPLAPACGGGGRALQISEGRRLAAPRNIRRLSAFSPAAGRETTMKAIAALPTFDAESGELLLVVDAPARRGPEAIGPAQLSSPPPEPSAAP
jgi:hypothetical protein